MAAKPDKEANPISQDRCPSDGDVGTIEEFRDDAREKQVVHKVDLCLMTLFGALYLMSFLDRGNIGNANLTGFSDDLGLVDNEFGAAVSLVYATYVVFEPVWAVLLKVLTPKYVMTGSTLSWAAITIATAFTKNFQQLAVCRVLLGVAEAAVSPCITMYITMVYKRNEYATRKSYVSIAAAFSGAFGGLMAFGLTRINVHGIHGWQWMYIAEGLISFILAPITFFWLPNSIAEAKWLSKDEKAIMAVRLQENRGVYNEQEVFSWAEVKRALKDWKLYVQGVSHFGIITTLYAITTFMPKIIHGMGFSSNVEAQLLTVPVYFVAGLSYYLLARMSDRMKNSSNFLMTSLILVLIGYIILIAVPTVGVRYFGLFVLAAGVWGTSALNVVWCTTMHAGYFKRAVASGFIQLVGNSSGAAIGFIFTTQSAPRYMQGMWFAFGMTLMSICCTIILSIALRRENARRRKMIANGCLDQPELGDQNPHFQYFQ